MPEVDESFADILKTPAVDIVPPPLCPQGHWVLRVRGYRLGKQNNENQTKFVLWDFDPKVPCMDVEMPEEALDLSQKKLFKKFWLTDNPQTKVRLKKFLISCGVDTEDGSSLKECMEMAKGQEVIAHVNVEDADSGLPEDRYNEVGEGFIHMDELDTVNG
jgi:hypothetical protein